MRFMRHVTLSTIRKKINLPCTLVKFSSNFVFRVFLRGGGGFICLPPGVHFINPFTLCAKLLRSAQNFYALKKLPKSGFMKSTPGLKASWNKLSHLSNFIPSSGIFLVCEAWGWWRMQTFITQIAFDQNGQKNWQNKNLIHFATLSRTI